MILKKEIGKICIVITRIIRGLCMKQDVRVQLPQQFARLLKPGFFMPYKSATQPKPNSIPFARLKTFLTLPAQ